MWTSGMSSSTWQRTGSSSHKKQFKGRLTRCRCRPPQFSSCIDSRLRSIFNFGSSFTSLISYSSHTFIPVHTVNLTFQETEHVDTLDEIFNLNGTNDRESRHRIWGSTCDQVGNDDILGMLSTPFEVRIRKQVCNSLFLSCSELILPSQSPTLSTTFERATALADLSYPWPDHRNWVLGSTGRKGGGWDGRAEYLGEFVKRRRLDGRELRNIIFLLHRDAYPPLQPLCDHFSHPIHNRRTFLHPSRQRSM